MDEERATVKVTGKAMVYLLVAFIAVYLIWRYYSVLEDAAEGFAREIKQANAKETPADAAPEKTQAQGEKAND